jgi:hypothetical protein
VCKGGNPQGNLLFSGVFCLFIIQKKYKRPGVFSFDFLKGKTGQGGFDDGGEIDASHFDRYKKIGVICGNP